MYGVRKGGGWQKIVLSNEEKKNNNSSQDLTFWDILSYKHNKIQYSSYANKQLADVERMESKNFFHDNLNIEISNCNCNR